MRLILLLFIFFTSLVWSQNSKLQNKVLKTNDSLSLNVDSIFQIANELYKKDDFEESILSYKKIINRNIDNKVLYYNIGNAYYKLNQLGYARLFYEKAKLYDFHDSDINHNINIVKSKMTYKTTVLEEFFLLQIFKDIRNYFSSSQWLVITLLLLYINLIILLLLLFVKSIKSKKTLLRLFFFFFVFSLIVSFFWILSGSSFHSNYAVLIVSDASLYSSPSVNSEELIPLREGEGLRFKVLDNIDNWSEVSLSNGNTGWIETQKIKIINK